VAVSHNKRIRYVPNELDAVIRFKVRLVIVIGQAPTAELARNFVSAARRVEEFVAAHAPPFIAKMYGPTSAERAKSPSAHARIDLWYPRR
jgi:hypothetical protein